MEPLQLRAHHGVCIAHFVGNGYNEAFTQNMKAVIARLAAAPNTPVCIISAEDVLCTHCPHNENGCTSLQKVLQLDAQVLAACGLHSGDVLPWQQFQQRVQTYVLQTHAVADICRPCEWYAFCLKIRQDKAACK